MKRRKFVIGAGALATGSAAAVGSGAFTSVEAGRDASVEVASDSNGYLSLEADPTETHGDEYAEETGDTIEFTFDSLNPEAETTIEDLLSVSNEGTQDVEVSVDFEDPHDIVSLSPDLESGEVLSPGDDPLNIDITFDTEGQGAEDFGTITIEFTADADADGV